MYKETISSVVSTDLKHELIWDYVRMHSFSIWYSVFTGKLCMLIKGQICFKCFICSVWKEIVIRLSTDN